MITNQVGLQAQLRHQVQPGFACNSSAPSFDSREMMVAAAERAQHTSTPCRISVRREDQTDELVDSIPFSPDANTAADTPLPLTFFSTFDLQHGGRATQISFCERAARSGHSGSAFDQSDGRARICDAARATPRAHSP
ncbi:hypothetical protein WOLCODRAFT_139282 [Wolfiporia cocos MD-104 SS10]|uniref:Uncharacterized protein n=1 Tax=Wolfiporia cocos (strain MD-104) TaxID=742152 RepID=A0A2H3K3U7_WOLCO|nr:hypothetical protein WOLCODRAFT_139282 [Wolfiporia cocos MD-104 SS10]